MVGGADIDVHNVGIEDDAALRDIEVLVVPDNVVSVVGARRQRRAISVAVRVLVRGQHGIDFFVICGGETVVVVTCLIDLVDCGSACGRRS